MLLDKTQSLQIPQRAQSQISAAGGSSSASTFSAAAAIKCAATYGLLMLGGAAARALSTSAEDSSDTWQVPLKEGVHMQPTRHLAAAPQAEAPSSSWPLVPTVVSAAKAIAPVTAPTGQSSPIVQKQDIDKPAGVAGQATIPHAGSTTYDTYLEPLSSHNVLDGKAGIGKQFVLTPMHNSATQIFNVQTPGQIMLSTSSRNLCLDVKNGKFESGTPVIAEHCKDSNNQQWNAAQNKDGTITFTPAASSNLCLDIISSGKNANKTQLYQCNSGKNQQWSLISAG